MYILPITDVLDLHTYGRAQLDYGRAQLDYGRAQLDYRRAQLDYRRAQLDYGFPLSPTHGLALN